MFCSVHSIKEIHWSDIAIISQEDLETKRLTNLTKYKIGNEMSGYDMVWGNKKRLR